jgi:hypothetical protein
VEVAWSGWNVNGVLAKGFQRNYFKGTLVRRGEDHKCRRPVAMRTEPICGGNAPPIARHKTWETVVWHRGAQIVADGQLMLEKLGSDHRADGVASMVFGSGLATPVTVEPRHGVGTARLQFSTYDVSIDHGSSIAEKSPHFEVSSTDGLYFRKEPVAEEWDLNPRKVSLHTISNRADSAALALLQQAGVHSTEMNTGSQGYPRRLEARSGSLTYAEVQSGGRVPCDGRS